MAGPILELPRYTKRVIVLSVDVSLCLLTVWLAFYLRLGEFIFLSGTSAWAAIVSVGIALPIFVVSGLYRSIFRYSGWPAILAVSRAVAIYGLLYASVITAFGISGIPRTVGLIQPLLLLFTVAGSRAFARYWLGDELLNYNHQAMPPKALVYGAGSAGRQLVSAQNGRNDLSIIGYLDDDSSLHGNLVNGQPVFAPEQLTELIETKAVTHVLLAIPSLSRQRRNAILETISSLPITVRTLPSILDLVEGRVTASDLRELDIDDLLSRETVKPDHILLTKNITAKVVLVSGAGGSIGSELCRQILRHRPDKLLLIELSEYALYSIHKELESISEGLDQQIHCQIIPLIASVQDGLRISQIMKSWKPDTVYHAAAYKHVPLVEHNIAEGLRNNIFGTLTTVKAALGEGVSDFVLISTDKAVRPTNVMGASKRLAELCLQALYAEQISATGTSFNKTKFSIVRFGNVLDSSGSVIPKFRKQILDGGPVTLTHPEITRYFMTIPEAAQLVIQAGAMANDGCSVFILDMGVPVKIMELAQRMIELSGLSVRDETNPQGDIEIVVTGLRPGEKLFEELLLGDNPQPTLHPKIQKAHDPLVAWCDLEPKLRKLGNFLDENAVEAALALLNELVTEYQQNKEIVDWIYVRQNDRETLNSEWKDTK